MCSATVRTALNWSDRQPTCVAVTADRESISAAGPMRSTWPWPAQFGLIVASRWEASSYAALDAMAAGLPVVATRVDGVEDIVAHNETGLLVAPANPLALGRQIDELLRDRARARAFGLAGRARVAREFSLERMISRTLAAYGVASVERESTPTR